MPEELTTERAVDARKARDIAITAGFLVGLVIFVALVIAGLAEFSCVGDDTVQWPPEGSSRKDFCDNVPYGLGILLAPLATLVGGVAAVRRRAGLLLLTGLLLGLAIAITPLVLIRDTSKACPGGGRAIDFVCQR